MNEWLLGYLFGWAVWSIVMFSERTWTDFIASIIIGTIWPVHAPAMIIKSLIR